MAAQKQVLQTRNINKVINKENVDCKCTMCCKRDETIVHIVSKYPKLVKKQFKNQRYDGMENVVH